jgi:hypothetical protein
MMYRLQTQSILTRAELRSLWSSLIVDTEIELFAVSGIHIRLVSKTDDLK